MFKLFGENYYFDIDKIEKEVELHISTGESQIHLVKYEVVKMLLDTILTEVEQVDETLGDKSNELTIPFKLAFNTLLFKKIINKI
jgi:hypothetical protein